jgi:K+-sensing histidine kinase KdpD
MTSGCFAPSAIEASSSGQFFGLSKTCSSQALKRAFEGPANQAMDGVVPVIAHELRGPLTAMATASELLLTDLDKLDRDHIRTMLSSIFRGAVWLQGLVENLLWAARVDEGELKLSRQSIGIIDIVAEMRTVVGPVLAHRNQSLRISSRGILRNVVADPTRIGQLILNLISNASKFAAEGTTIDLSLAERGNMQRITVSDRGPGIPIDEPDKLFEAFTQIELDGRGNDGIGLGLAIVKSIATAHEGRVGAVNRRRGGACFWVELPIASGGSDSGAIQFPGRVQLVH